MKKLLPGFLLFLLVLLSFVTPPVAHAQAPQAVPTGAGLWVVDSEVTFIGKNARRSGDLLDWALQNYNWVCVTKVADRQCDNSNNPLAQFWSEIVIYIVTPLLFVVILATSAVIIITRGKSLTIMRFIPRFVAVILLIVFSYSLLQFFYQFFDLIQGFFLRSDIKLPCPPNCISNKDLLYVGWNYQQFIGLRLLGDAFAESAFISLLLTKLTALTYYVMVGILLMRKIILWFFIIVSPIFPLLLLYYPVRNTGKIWIGEFFRWLLYAPLFAIFLNGLVFMWRQQIPLNFTPAGGAGLIGNQGAIIYPTAVNILLGGPKQFVTPTNSVNLTETFALYVVALIMLWVVILLPWILLQIFLDYAANFSPGESAVMKTLVNLAGNKPIMPGPGKSPTPGSTSISIPFTKKFKIPTNLGPNGAAKEFMHEKEKTSTSTPATTTTENRFGVAMNVPIGAVAKMDVTAQAINMTGIKVPTMRDIAKMDAALINVKADVTMKNDLKLAKESLDKIANPNLVQNTVEREKVTELRDKLQSESAKGNQLATALLNAANSQTKQRVKKETASKELKKMADPGKETNVVNRDKMQKMNQMLQQQSTTKDKSGEIAKDILSVSDKTTEKDVEKLQSKLERARVEGDNMSTQVMNHIDQQTQTAITTENVNSALSSISHSNTNVMQGGAGGQGGGSSDPNATVEQRSKMLRMHAELEKESKSGNEIATAVLKISDKTSKADMEALGQKIMNARDKGDKVAAQIAELGQIVVSTPAANRVQNVSKEDYEAVKTMWTENYSNLEVPEGMAGNRSEWIKDDITKIDTIIGLLSSSDPEKLNRGMDEVSNILPFLLMGGFSSAEIMSYLKAKQDAAKDVVKSIAAEEDTKVTVEAGHAHAEKTMAATMDDEETTSSSTAASAGSSSKDDDAEDKQFGTGEITEESVKAQQKPAAVPETPELYKQANLRVLKVTDIAEFETNKIKNDQAKLTEFNNMRTILQKIANPAKLPADAEKEQFNKLLEHLKEERTKGNETAKILLAAADHAGEKGTGAAVDAQTTIAANPVQKVNDVDFEAVEKIWEENYHTLPLLNGSTNAADRIEWIKQDTTGIKEIIDLLQSQDTAKHYEALNKVSDILPFLLLGGFSQNEITGYLLAKLQAGNKVISDLEHEEGTKVTVPANEKVSAPKEMSADAEKNKDN